MAFGPLALSRLGAVAVGLFALVACGTVTTGPVFVDIQSVTVRHLDRGGGLVDMRLSQDQVNELRNCLYQSGEVTKEQLDPELLPSSYLLVVDDAAGRRNFELNSAHNFENKGHYYQNYCLYQLIQSL